MSPNSYRIMSPGPNSGLRSVLSRWKGGTDSCQAAKTVGPNGSLCHRTGSEREQKAEVDPSPRIPRDSREAWVLLALRSGAGPQRPRAGDPTRANRREGGGAHSPGPAGDCSAPRPPLPPRPRVGQGSATVGAGPGGYLGLSRRISAAAAAILEAPSPGRYLSAAPGPANGGRGGREPGRATPRRCSGQSAPRAGAASCPAVLQGPGHLTVLRLPL